MSEPAASEEIEPSVQMVIKCLSIVGRHGRAQGFPWFNTNNSGEVGGTRHGRYEIYGATELAKLICSECGVHSSAINTIAEAIMSSPLSTAVLRATAETIERRGDAA